MERPSYIRGSKNLLQRVPVMFNDSKNHWTSLIYWGTWKDILGNMLTASEVPYSKTAPQTQSAAVLHYWRVFIKTAIIPQHSHI